MNWTEAVKLMREGKAVTIPILEEWEDCYLAYTHTKIVTPSELWNSFNKEAFKNAENVLIEGYYTLCCIKQNNIIIYEPTKIDTKRTDWEEFKI